MRRTFVTALAAMMLCIPSFAETSETVSADKETKKEKKNVTPDANKISRQPGRKKTEKSLIGLQLFFKKRENH